MPDLNVVAVITAKPGSEEILHDALLSLVAPSRAEPGNISYELFRSDVDASTFINIERWRSQADLDAHMQTPHVQRALAQAGDAIAAAPAIHPLTPIDD